MKGILAGTALLASGVAWLASPLATAAAAPRAAQLPTTGIAVAAASGSRVYDGVGAILGGGGNARYLLDYPARQRSQILDYLFKPGYGASLQLLKLEIGGDANSSDGSEPSVEHSAGHVNCHAGYELSIASRAVALNPQLKLYGLQWTAPRLVKARRGRAFHRPRHQLPAELAGLRPAARPDHQLPGWLERDRQWHKRGVVPPAPAGPQRARLPKGPAHRGGLLRQRRLALRPRHHHPDPGHARCLRLPDRHRRPGYPVRVTVVDGPAHGPEAVGQRAGRDGRGRAAGLHGAVRPGHGPRRCPRLRGRPADRLPGVAGHRRHAAGPAVREPRPRDSRPAVGGQLPGQRDDLGHRPADAVRPAPDRLDSLALHQSGQRVPPAQPGRRFFRQPGPRLRSAGHGLEHHHRGHHRHRDPAGGLPRHRWRSPGRPGRARVGQQPVHQRVRRPGPVVRPPAQHPAVAVRPLHPDHLAGLGVLADHHERPGPRPGCGPGRRAAAAAPD